jgi:hypothetical protein
MTPTPAQTQSYIDHLYHRDGRHIPGHPMRGLYTGLLQERIAQLLDEDRRAILTE